MYKYFEFLTDIEIGFIKDMHPKQAKSLLARSIVAQFYNEKIAEEENNNFEKTFSKKQNPEDILEFKLSENNDEDFVSILLKCNLIKSKNEYRRLVRQGSISYEGQKIEDEAWEPQKGVVKIGKRRFLKIL